MTAVATARARRPPSASTSLTYPRIRHRRARQQEALRVGVRRCRDKVAKKENVKILRGGTPATNKKIIKINVEKLGWKITGTRRVISRYDGTEYEEVQMEKEL